ncbi:TetR family transcriptional regulator C-terminal domain-containing protein [Streptomyces sp. HUCO-GS316]|uniref:TetR family transcriptional regulator C-terminal domain-containing protein n=1 Tax=Streptomyces sp. HUCO-GS316 TaxID=2692198 RepID=UPI00301E0F03
MRRPASRGPRPGPRAPLGAGSSTPPRRGTPRPTGSLDRFRGVWARMLESMDEFRPIWTASLEIATQGDRVPELRKLMAKAQTEGRSGLVALFTGADESTLDDRTVRTLGGFYQALLNGLMVQWLFDPAAAAAADDLTEELCRVLEGVRETD